MAGFDPDQPRDQQGQWSAASGGTLAMQAKLRRLMPTAYKGKLKLLHALRLRGVRINPHDTQAQFAMQSSTTPAILTTPTGATRRKDLGRGESIYAVGHEMGHLLNVRAKLAPRSTMFMAPTARVFVERRAWATGLRWMKRTGLKPKLSMVKLLLPKTLGQYATVSGHPIGMAIGGPRLRATLMGIKPSNFNNHSRLLKMK